MENYNFYMTGEIKGITKEEKENENKAKFQYIIKNIKEEINLEFKNKPYIHIYDKFYKKYNILKLFTTPLKNTKYNKKNIDITFLIVVKEDYPNSPPMIYCLTELNQNLDIFDVRNIQKNLIPEWSSHYTINNIIDQLFPFIENFDYQINKKLLPSIGEYYIQSTVYDINDFLLNENINFSE